MTEALTDELKQLIGFVFRIFQKKLGEQIIIHKDLNLTYNGAILFNLAVYTIVLPAALTLLVLEHLIINPIKGVGEQLITDEHETFIEEVTSSYFIT